VSVFTSLSEFVRDADAEARASGCLCFAQIALNLGRLKRRVHAHFFARLLSSPLAQNAELSNLPQSAVLLALSHSTASDLCSVACACKVSLHSRFHSTYPSSRAAGAQGICITPLTVDCPPGKGLRNTAVTIQR
jgi:hypothetical protein